MSVIKTEEINNNNNQCASASKIKCIGQNSNSIGIGDRSVVTNMGNKGRKRGKKKEIVFRYIPSEKGYTPQQLDEFLVKEEQLINYVIEHLLYQKAPSN